MSSQLISKQSASQQYTEQRWNEPAAQSGNVGQNVGHQGQVSGGVVVGSTQHQTMWEHGQIDYTGRDSFSNIQAHLDAQLPKKE